MKKSLIKIAQRRRTIMALLIFTGLATALLHRALLPGYTLLPLDLIPTIAPWDHLDAGILANTLISDPLYIFFPSRYFQAAAIQAGQIPLWNPYIMSGSPILADPNFQPFYPPNLIAAVFAPVQHALPWLAWGHLILTGGLMYGFLRQRKLVWLASVLGGGVWMLNAYLVVWLENPHRLSTLAWLPGIFWAYQKAVDERRLDYAIVGGLLLGLSILGGQVQFVFATGLALGIYVLGMILWDRYEHGGWSLRPAGPLIVVGIIGLGIGAVMLLPSSEFAAYSQRGRYTAESILRTSFPFQQIVTLVSPDFYGNPANPGRYWGHLPNYAELAAYFGVVAFLIALTAPLSARRRQFAFIAIVLAIVSSALVLGTPLVKVLFLFPGAQFIALRRFLFLLPFCGAWLAAIGLDGWLTSPDKRRWVLLPILILLSAGTVTTLLVQNYTPISHPATYVDLTRSVVFLLLASNLLLLLPRRPRVFGGLLVLLAFVDLVQWGWDFNPITSTDYLYPDNEVVEYLEQDTSYYRVLPLQRDKLVFGPNVLSIYNIQEIGGYSSLIQADYYNFYKQISDQVDFYWLRSSPYKLAMSEFEPRVSLLNAKYILSAKPLPTNDILQVDRLVCDEVEFLSADWSEQAFTATQPGLNRIDILLAPRPSGEEATIQFRLWAGDIGDDLVAETEILATPSDTPEAHTIYFKPVPDSAGQTFMWGITGDQDTAICVSGADQTLAFSAYGTQLISIGERDGVWIYENPNTLPRAYLVHHVETVPGDRLLDRVVDPSFDPYHSVLLSSPLPGDQSEQLAPSPIRAQGDVQIANYDLHQVDLEVTTGQPAILVLADAHYQGWNVIVDGVQQDLLEVNSVFRGVFLPAGSHTVTFQFRPTTLYWGIGIAGFSLAMAVAVLLLTYRRRKATSAGDE